MKRKIKIIVMILIIFALSMIILKIYDIEEPIIIQSAKITEHNSSMLSMLFETDDGIYEVVSDTKWPTKGYKLNNNLSGCEHGGILKWDDKNEMILLESSYTDKCFAYFNYNSTVTVEDITSNASIGPTSFTDIATINDTGLYSGTDDWGTTYYYRGLVDNNWVYFAGYYWRIIRFNGDGSIRLIYSGKTKPTEETRIVMTGTNTHIIYSDYNTGYNDNYYLGYMYGVSASQYSVTHANRFSSTIKTVLDSWFFGALFNYTNYLSYEAGFCNDREVKNGVHSSYSGNGTVQKATTYAPWGRLYSNTKWKTSQTPTFKCTQIENDLFTTSLSTKGNKKLEYPIGLITVDEAVFAGAFGGQSNSDYWLYTGSIYWTMSPMYYYGSYNGGYVFAIYNELLAARLIDGRGVRPVINLISGTMFIGDGTWEHPYEVV